MTLENFSATASVAVSQARIEPTDEGFELDMESLPERDAEGHFQIAPQGRIAFTVLFDLDAARDPSELKEATLRFDIVGAAEAAIIPLQGRLVSIPAPPPPGCDPPILEIRLDPPISEVGLDTVRGEQESGTLWRGYTVQMRTKSRFLTERI